jgi:serine/threonine protein kinase
MKKQFDDEKYEDIKVIRKIGNGMMGSVYLGTIDNKNVAIKVAKILPSYMKEGNATWKELEFYNTFAKKHADTFQIYSLDYKIQTNCDKYKIDGKVFKHPASLKIVKNWPTKYRKEDVKLRKSKYCLINIIPYIKGRDINYYILLYGITKYTPPRRKKYYSFVVDILKKLRLLHMNGFSHNDIHGYNVLVTNKGATLIDYGLVDSRQWNPNWSPHNDYIQLFYNILFYDNAYDVMVKLNNKFGDKRFSLGDESFYNDVDRFMRSSTGKDIYNMCKGVPLQYRSELAFKLGLLIVPNYIKILLFSEFEKEFEFESKFLISYEDVLFFINNVFKRNGINKVIKHFSLKL